MAVSHVAYGKEADPDHQNSLIDTVNLVVTQVSALAVDVADLETAIVTKAELCSDLPEDTGITPQVGSSPKASPCNHKHKAVGSAAPQDVADAATVGIQPLASREDHKHKGVSQIEAGTNITIDPATGVGKVKISAAAAGTTIQTETFTATDITLEADGTYSLGSMSIPGVILGIKLDVTFPSAAVFRRVHARLEANVSEANVCNTGRVSIEADQSGQVIAPYPYTGGGDIRKSDTALNCILYEDASNVTQISSVTVTVYYL